MRDNRFLIISEPRTGSNNLSYCLDAHPGLVVGNELLHPQNGVRPDKFGLDPAISETGNGYHWISQVEDDVRARVLAGIFQQHNGFKIHTQHVPVGLIVDIVREYDCHVILTRRMSIFDQAISNYIATARNRWHADEKVSNQVDVGPFEISPEHFIQWVEGIINVRRDLWGQLGTMADRVIMVEYESFYSGSHEERVRRVNELYSMLGLEKLGSLDEQSRAQTLKKLQHYLDSDRQKLTDEVLVVQLVRNLAEIRQLYAQWIMRSYAKPALT